ncbi:MAG: LamG-like jellyroll fold domain-containing protein [Bacteroidota bacterium]
MKKLYIIIILTIIGFKTIDAQIPTNGLLAWYQMNGNALDSSGNANNGVLNGPVPTTDRWGHPNKALLFNGNGQYISVANNVWSDALTLSAWIYVNDFGSTSSQSSGKGIFFKAPNTGYNQDYDVNVGYDANADARACFVFGQGSSQYMALISNSILQTNQWYLITASRENGVAKMYINGSLDKIVNFSFTPYNQNHNLNLGMTTASVQSFSGKLDEMRIYNRALTVQEISAIYNEQLITEMLAWYPCDGNANDTSGNNFNAIINGPVFTTDRYNHSNKALLFNGNGDYLDVPYNIWSSNLTLSAWIYGNDFGSTNPLNSGKLIFFKAPNTGSNSDYMLSVGNDANSQARVSFNFGQGSSDYTQLFSNTILQPLQWYLVTASRENGISKLYINGNLDATTTYSFTPVNQNFNLSLGMSNVSMQSFSGKLDDLRIYNYALNNGQITGLYSSVAENSDIGKTMQIFPNPASDHITINTGQIQNQQNTTVSIYDIQGQLLLQQTIVQLQTELNISHLANGVYLVKVNNDKNTLVSKFVKE